MVGKNHNRKGYTDETQLKIHMYALQDQINDAMESYLNNNHTHFRLDGKPQTLETQLQVIAAQTIIALQKYKDITGERSQ